MELFILEIECIFESTHVIQSPALKFPRLCVHLDTTE